MKYRAGDKFIIEIECRSNISPGGLYKVKGFNTLVFDERGLDRLEQVWEQRHWTPKPEEIQVGDEVEYAGEFGIVIHRGDTYHTVLDRDFDRREWGVYSCHRTGKTYTELIKALESLPKE